MSAERHPLTLQVEELFLNSNLTPKLNFLLLQGIDDYFKQQTIEISDNLPYLVKQLYSIADDELYTIISWCNHDGYQAVLLHPLSQFIRESAKETIRFVKESDEYRNKSLEKAIRGVNALMKIVLEVLKDSTRTTRKAIGYVPAPEVEYPDFATLKRFYECDRKVRYDTYEEAESNLAEQNDAYACPHCFRYHQGRATLRNAPAIPEEITRGRYQTVWRRHHKI